MDFYEDLQKIREKRPLIHHITNYVVMNDSANITISLGASPIMAHEPMELEDLISIADALYINIGTLDKKWIESMELAGKIAEKYNVPLLLDPVGAGASKLRTEVATKLLLSFPVKILKGNGGEINSLAGSFGGTKGVESTVNGNMETADIVSEKFNTTVIITGKIDYVSDGKRKAMVENGTPFLTKITGSGCMLGSIISSYMAVNSDPFISSIEGLLTYEIAAEFAEKKSDGPGTFKTKLMDEIYLFNKEKFSYAKVKYL
ncbi:MAG: hydroxyethylthiazole kinase [Thermoplasmata archaeon]|nr:hydroxyethylthiazole kinase [Staphylococcus epidermidis]